MLRLCVCPFIDNVGTLICARAQTLNAQTKKYESNLTADMGMGKKEDEEDAVAEEEIKE